MRAEPQAQEAADGPVPCSLQLGAARLLGRYLAEAPAALRREAVLRALPGVMAVRDTVAGAAAGRGGSPGGGAEEGEEDFALAFLLPGLLQATSPGAEGRSEVLDALRASPTAVHACIDYLAHCVSRVAAAVPHMEHLLAAAAAGAAPAAAAAAAGLGSAAHRVVVRWEQGLADVAALLLNVLEPPALTGRMAWCREEPASGAALGAGPYAWDVVQCLSGGDPALASAAQAADTAAAQHLPPLMAALQPACWLLARWAAARGPSLQALALLDVAGAAGSDAGCGSAALELSRSQLVPRALLCGCCLAAVVLSATMRHLADKMQLEPGSMLASAAASILPPLLVGPLCSTALAAAGAGASLELKLGSGADADRPDAGGSDVRMGVEEELHGTEPALGARWLTPAGALEDYPGDGELAWARLLGACVQLLELSDAMRRVAQGSVWLRQLTAALGGECEPAVQDLLADVNVALLLQALAANM